MAEPLLTDIFGPGASQTATHLTIAKADLPGVIAQENNRGETLVAGLTLRVKSGLTQANFENNEDQNIYLSDGFPSFTFRGPNQTQYRVDQVTLNFAKLDNNTSINPQDY